MKSLRLIAPFAAALALSACASVEAPTRDTLPFPPQPEALPIAVPQQVADRSAPVAETAALSVHKIVVRVPQSLKVSEANRYWPNADIVWREDPFGDRYAQVQAIFEAAMARGVADFRPGRDVILDIQVTRFHALTEKARIMVGGVHDLHFFVTLVDAQTGRRLMDPWHVETELKAYGGTKALEAMHRGETQKVRITRHLAQVIKEELARVAPAAPAPLTGVAYSSKGR
ncbi:DUF6778 family protein [Rhodovulum adriaticum]|uniref:Lipoprotein n=1 Tax=Rhodovulum adriaticum TaxID=35804 RepID=A0A4R2NVK0_RHOAD|nr:DUF6778 family protein [Rhodovulum adriaticum]TCP26149.1 hypothetical protein EV656_102112 [Rhodovulum adriaticum]